MVKEGCRVVWGVVAPNASEEIFNAIFEEKKSHVSDELKTLMSAYTAMLRQKTSRSKFSAFMLTGSHYGENF